MSAVTPGQGQGFKIDSDQARQVVQKLKESADKLTPAASTPTPDATGPEKTTAAIAAVFAASEHFSKECGTFLQQAATALEHAVKRFENIDHHNAASISAVDPRNM